ncbi:hypothetical protein Lqui_1938 [Legionella quinlivanii]|uniref:Transmembrane protein n=1 Tax=Legionella quinlivanii TaxID=45073 RepID=A0A0W0XZ50_9GAMM|nr:hypothetical protein [Legionella quinlivanii]KTD49727.1 hypothetical protein Lqui_1938 [Legionella quinlivanii]SEG23450.1 hypothetical protein SAMN02746093_02264 [Legionella quinlivanii DSM 21216]STY09892.1 Uncharacterised protein [Legionella quinlivanii]
MTKFTKQNLKFVDVSLGPKGFLIWMFFPALFFILFLMTICIDALLHISEAQDALVHLIGGSMVSWFLFRVSCTLLFALKSVQEIIVDGDYLCLRSFLGRKDRFHIDTLLDVTYLKNNWFFTESPIFKVGGEHIELLFKTKSKVYIGDNVDGYSELKAILGKKINQRLKLDNQELNFVDHIYGSKGRQIWLALPSCVFFILVFFCGIVCFSNSSLNAVERIVIILGILLAMAFVVLSMRTIFLATKTAQNVSIDNNSIKIRFFSGCTKKYFFSEIISIQEVKNTRFFTEDSNLFMQDKNHLLIKLQNKKKIYMSENFEYYDKLKLALLERFDQPC